jgi:glycosyltransferase involved in cell wall biosynthesis
VSAAPPQPDPAVLRVGFLCSGDPLDMEAFSGILFRMRAALADAGGDVRLIGRDAVRQTVRKRLIRKVRQKLLGKGVNWTSGQGTRHARGIAADMRQHRPDVVFAPVASGLVGQWAFPDVPIVHVTDATPKRLFGYYDRYTGPDAERAFAASDRDERLAVSRAAAVIVSSQWGKDSLVRDYAADPDAVHVVPLGANVTGTVTDTQLDQRDLTGPLRLVFIGAAWARKGGDLAVGATEALRRRGIDAHLHLIGSRPPGDAPLPDGVHDEGWCDKRKPDDAAKLDRLLRSAHLLILPTRADCTPVAINEAHAYGLPAIATDTGGVGSVLAPGVTGTLVPPEADADAWTDAVADLWTDRDRYRAAARAAKQRFETHLSWPAWGQRVRAILAQQVRASEFAADPR